jgi:outer membrane protein TolC
MRYLLISVYLLAGKEAVAQQTMPGSIRLKDCVQAAWANKANIKSSKTDAVVAGLQKEEARGRYLPDISLAYEYRYYPIIATQVIPSGQFLPVPTGELRPIKFGTSWQQNAGLTVYQPIIDGTIKNRVEESRINERVKQADVKIAEEELAYEVLKTFSRIMQFTEQKASAAADTARTFQTITYIRNRFVEGKILKTELNKALLNHYNALNSYQSAHADLVKEKFYLAYLTSIPVAELLDKPYEFSPLTSPLAMGNGDIVIDSIAQYQQLNERRALLGAQARTEQRKPLPTLGFQGFLGANQFTNNFNPVESNTWFGNSYVGLQVKVPILSSENRSVRVKQYAGQQVSLDQQKEDLRQQLLNDYRQAGIEAIKTQQQIALAEQNVRLLEENVSIYQERVSAGRESTHELLLQEIDLQKEKASLLKLKADLANNQVEQVKASGRLMEFVRGL